MEHIEALMPYFWLLFIVCAVVAEAATPALIAIWFLPGSIIALVLSFFGIPIWIQATVFFAASLLLLILSRTVWKKYIKSRPTTPTNADMVIGKCGVVIEDIDNIKAVGLVKINSQTWSAKAIDCDFIAKDTIVEITALEGVKVVCKIK